MKIAYLEKRLRPATYARIEQINEIIAEYEADGYDLTVRQIYYQLLSRDLISNSTAEYNKIKSIVSDARLCGLIDWDAVTDRTRFLRGVRHEDGPSQMLDKAVDNYRIDKWEDQPTRVEVWIEKDALIGILGRVCPRLDVNYFSCRGYVSQTAMKDAADRILSYSEMEQPTVILHLGDHDPSGLDMTRDIRDRLEMFTEHHDIENPLTVKRIALTMDQVREFDPKPNPAKQTDIRFKQYQKLYGDESWELDALSPRVLDQLITSAVEAERDDELWNFAVQREQNERKQIKMIADNWDLIVEEWEGYTDGD